MEREIEFRGRCFSDGSWVYGDLEYERKPKDFRKVRIHTYKEDGGYDRQYLVESDTVGEYTGLKDRNGVKIFEGDILYITVFDCFDNDKQYKVRVEWFGSEFVGVGINETDSLWSLGWLRSQDEEMEIIGNIHDK